jgi:HEAT repeat protein
MADSSRADIRVWTSRKEYPSADGRFVLVHESAHELHKSDPLNLPGMEQVLDFRDSGLKGGEARLTLFERAARKRALCWAVPYEGILPRVAYVADGGRHVVLRGASPWQPQGPVLVFLGPRGEVNASYRLEEILPRHEVRTYLTYMDGEPWADHGVFFFRRRETQFAFATRQGTLRVFDLASGKCLPLTRALQRKVRSEALSFARKWLTSRRAVSRESGAVMVGALGDRESVPALKRLLRDRSVLGTVGVGDRPPEDRYGVRLAAGGALAAILGEGAAPLLERKLPGLNPYMTTKWVDLLSSIGRAHLSPGVAKLCDSDNEYLREAAIRAVAETDDGTVLRQHPQWARSRTGGFYFAVVKTLAQDPRPEDEEVLRAALQDRDSGVARRALDALARLSPPGLDAVLRQSLHHRHDLVAAGAVLHLAERGDRRAMQRLLAYLKAPWPLRRDSRLAFNDHEIARLIARTRPHGAEAVLQAAAAEARTPSDQISFIGALAALGDVQSLSDLRLLALEGHPYAIMWLGFCRDTASVEFLHDQFSSNDPEVREAAREALREMGE